MKKKKGENKKKKKQKKNFVGGTLGGRCPGNLGREMSGEPWQGDVRGTLGSSPRCPGNLGKFPRSFSLKIYEETSGEPLGVSGTPLGDVRGTLATCGKFP